MISTNNLSIALGIDILIETFYIELQDLKTITLMQKELKLKNKPCIYVFHLNDSQKCYVGSTIEPHVRFKNHLFGTRHE